MPLTKSEPSPGAQGPGACAAALVFEVPAAAAAGPMAVAAITTSVPTSLFLSMMLRLSWGRLLIDGYGPQPAAQVGRMRHPTELRVDANVLRSRAPEPERSDRHGCGDQSVHERAAVAARLRFPAADRAPHPFITMQHAAVISLVSRVRRPALASHSHLV